MSFTPVLFESRHIPDESARFVAAVNKLESFGISVSLSAQRGFFTQGVRDSKPFRIRFHLPDRIHNLDLARRDQILANDPQTAGVAEIPWQVAGEIRACFHDILQDDFGTHFMMATAWDHSHLDDARGHNTRTKSGSYQVHYAAGGLFYTGMPDATRSPRPLFADRIPLDGTGADPAFASPGLGIFLVNAAGLSAHARLGRLRKLTHILSHIAAEQGWGAPRAAVTAPDPKRNLA